MVTVTRTDMSANRWNEVVIGTFSTDDEARKAIRRQFNRMIHSGVRCVLTEKGEYVGYRNGVPTMLWEMS